MMPPDPPDSIERQSPASTGTSSAGGGLILAFTTDLMLVPRLEDVARQLGQDLWVIERPQQLGAEGEPSSRHIPLTEPLEGPDAGLVRRLVEERPVLILVDTTAGDLPWARWIQVLKTSAATRRIPIVAFGPHVEEADLRRAREAGADLALARGAFLHQLPELIRTWSVRPDMEALAAACRGELSALARRGIELINEGEYFEAHEVLEHAWMEASPADGTVYRALLQVAVAMLQVERKNPRGAAKMVLRVRQWLDPLPDQCKGLDLAAVKRTVAELDASLRSGTVSQSTLRIPLPP